MVLIIKSEKLEEKLEVGLTVTYQHFEDVDLVNEGRVVLDLLLLDCLDGKLLSALAVLS